MRVLMLGWEFPPDITGGLGTACYGLTRAMSARGTDVLLMLPKAVVGEYTAHVKLLCPQRQSPVKGGDLQAASGAFPQSPASEPVKRQGGLTFRSVAVKATPPHMASVYPSGGLQYAARGRVNSKGIGFIYAKPPASVLGQEHSQVGGESASPEQQARPGFGYDGDLPREARRYADLCLGLASGERFDVIHAHDWLTFPAAQALAAATGKPWIAHVHSMEYDRAGQDADAKVVRFEREGVHQADRVIAVSEYTRQLLFSRYGLAKERCEVVYNGVERVACHGGGQTEPVTPTAGIQRSDKIVLYLGRVTMQKGPEYFVAAAKKVLEKMSNVKFVVAGSGDQIEQTIEQAAKAGIGSKITFTGFLHRNDVRRVYEMADVYVMPSVSEPFGIAPLEAISHQVPVIISRQAGVSEVLEHVLKVDFWDTHDIANKIIAVLRHPPLSQTIRKHADMEVRELTWDGAAAKCHLIYDQVLDADTQAGT